MNMEKLKTAFKKSQQLYGCSYVENLMQQYVDKGGEICTIVEGCLGYGLTICHGEGLKTAVIKEIYLNEWSSAHSIRMYNKCPKKYAEILDKYYDGVYDEEE